jgi:MYXO-CTERM domain-containing protein
MKHRGYLLFAAVAVLVPSVARADVIDEAESSCRSAKAGDACDANGEKGTCKATSCSRRDYSDGPPGKMVSSPCLRCSPGAPEAIEAKTTPAADKPSSSKGSACTVGQSTPAFGVMLLGLLALGALVRTRRS